MHLKRLIVALILLPLLYSFVMYLQSGFFFALLSILMVIGVAEFYSMYHVRGMLFYTGIICGLAILSISFFKSSLLIDAAVISVAILMAVRLFSRKTPVSSLTDVAPAIVGLLYIPGLLIYQIRLREIGPEWIVFLYATVWGSDSMAYYFGKAIGRRKLYAEVSPNKTVAGAFGSVAGGVIGAMLFKVLLIPGLSPVAAVAIGILSGITSIIGDLIESMFKRDAGVKDSGILIPGHGGMLDKADSMLFTAPVLYWSLQFLGKP
jgi:phosphatidate cytidylyltransferase